MLAASSVANFPRHAETVLGPTILGKNEPCSPHERQRFATNLRSAPA